MIKSFRHKGLERFFREDSKAGIQAAPAQRRLQGALVTCGQGKLVYGF
jgi:plasmid maintenance system killer protein